MLVYLAGPIDYAKDHNWRDSIRELLGKEFVFFDPFLAFVNLRPGCSSRVCHKAKEINDYAIRMADCMVLFADPPPEVFMVGSWRELEHARSCNKPVCIVSTRHSVYMYDATVVSSLGEAAEWVKELASNGAGSGS